MDLAKKDANHAVNLADEVGVDLKIVKVARAHLEELRAEAGPTGDLPGQVYFALLEMAPSAVLVLGWN